MIFGQPVFSEWLDFRRRATAQLVPDWKQVPETDRVQLLDLCAILITNQN